MGSRREVPRLLWPFRRSWKASGAGWWVGHRRVGISDRLRLACAGNGAGPVPSPLSRRSVVKNWGGAGCWRSIRAFRGCGRRAGAGDQVACAVRASGRVAASAIPASATRPVSPKRVDPVPAPSGRVGPGRGQRGGDSALPLSLDRDPEHIALPLDPSSTPVLGPPGPTPPYFGGGSVRFRKFMPESGP